MVIARADWIWWIDRFVWTYDPKRLELTTRPFVLFRRQRELAGWLQSIVERKQEGVLEKSRDVGASWMLAMFALHRWLFVPGFRTTFGSYKQEKVDRLGDSDSLFEKIRMALDLLPWWMRPAGWRPGEHANYMRLLNPQNDNEIVGEVGLNMGRAGRSTLFVVDEAAFLDHSKAVARAISANADARIWVSTANGMANGFYLKREAALRRDPTVVFRFHWRDDPRKTEAWAAEARSRMEPDDWASEYEIDYGASVERQLIKAEWIEACIELGRRHGHEITGEVRSGLDVGAGKAESVLATLRGPLLFDLSAWRDPDAVETAGAALERARGLGSRQVQYDATGVGFAQGAIMARINDASLAVSGINGGEPVPDQVRLQEGPRQVPAAQRFANLKAYGWWVARERARASFERLAGAAEHPLADCLLIGIDDPVLSAQLAQPTWSRNLRGRRQVDKAPNGARSPDRADALVLALIDLRTRETWDASHIVLGQPLDALGAW